ncbi:MAG: Coq4 family protein [Cyanobacteria bacterium P01_E01_bin.35]
MSATKDPQANWDELALTTFLEMVRARDGDLAVVAKLAQVLGDLDSMKSMKTFLKQHPEGEKAFQEYPRLGKIDLKQLHRLPNSSLGYIYSNHMLQRGFTPTQPKQVTNDYEFIGAHVSETHDIWHIVTGCDTDIIGEIRLEAFYVKQLRFSRFWLSLLVKNLLKTTIYQIENSEKYLDTITEGWLMAGKAKPLFGIQWNQLWHLPLEDIRASLNINIA